MPRLYNKQSGALLGMISDADVNMLIEQLEEEAMADVDYFVDPATVDILESAGASGALVQMLRAAIGNDEGVDIRWEK